MTSIMSRFILAFLLLALGAEAALRGPRNLGIGLTTESPTDAPVAVEVLPEPVVEPEPEPEVLPEPEPEVLPEPEPEVLPEPEPEVLPEPDLPTLAELAVNSTDLSTLVEIVTLVGLADALSLPGAYTVFAPTNDAFAAAIDLDNLALIDPAVLTEFLTYHVVLGLYESTDITDGLTLTTLQGETIEFDVTDSGITVNEENIIDADIIASNGIVHVIDGVMYPKSILGPPTESPTAAPVAR